jgi:hypothetical protein
MRSSMIPFLAVQSKANLPRANTREINLFSLTQFRGTTKLFAITFNASFQRGVKLLVDTLIRALLTYSSVRGFANRTGSRRRRTLFYDVASWLSEFGCDTDPESRSLTGSSTTSRRQTWAQSEAQKGLTLVDTPLLGTDFSMRVLLNKKY